MFLRLCSHQMLEPPHCLHLLLLWLCSRRIPCTGFFGCCAGTLRIFCTASPLALLPPTPSPGHAAAFGPPCLARTSNSFASPLSPLCPCPRSYRACAWPLSLSCFQVLASRPSIRPVLLPRTGAATVGSSSLCGGSQPVDCRCVRHMFAESHQCCARRHIRTQQH